MEKFGIFELLDALSALSASENGDFTPANEENAPIETSSSAPLDAKPSTADAHRSPDADNAFAPPVYGGYSGSGRAATDSGHASVGNDAAEKSPL